MAKRSKVFAKSDDIEPTQPTRAEQPLPVPIFPKDAPTEPTVTKLWGGGEHRKAALKAIDSNQAMGDLLRAFPDDEKLINDTIANVRSA